MAKDIQISAVISQETKDLLEKQVRASGIKKARLIETALHHHLRALQELPADAIVPPRLVLTRQSGEELLERLKTVDEPAEDLVKLLADDGDQTPSRVG